MEETITGGKAIHSMLSSVEIETQLSELKKEIQVTKSPTKRDVLVKQVKYLSSLSKQGTRPEDAYIINHMPVLPPIFRPPIEMPGNRIEYADANHLYKEHMVVNDRMKGLKDDNGEYLLPDSDMVEVRSALYDGAKAIVGLGDPLSGTSRAKNKKGFLKQIGGESGPKTGFFQNKILKKNLDFSGRATIYAEPNLGFNEAAIPIEMLWTMYAFHIIRDLVKNGYTYPEAKKAVADRTGPAQSSLNKLIKHIPVILNRAPTLMASNITAHFPVPVKGVTIGINPQHLGAYAGDYDGDALSCHVPITESAIAEAKEKLLPQSHIFDSRKGQGNSLMMPGHEAILGSNHITAPDFNEKTVVFKTESEALLALKEGRIKVNTPIQISG